MKKHQVLLVVRWPIGGIRTFLRYVYKNFERKAFRFTLIAPDLRETDVLLADLSGADLEYIPGTSDMNSRELLRLVTNTVRRQRFDLIHSHGLTAGVCSILGAQLKRIPHIITLHETLTEDRFVGARGVCRKLGLGLSLLLVDTIHCVSYDARNNLLDFLKLVRLVRKRVVVIPSGIEVERFLKAEERDLKGELGLSREHFLIGFFGRYMPEKGFRELVDALEGVNHQHHLVPQAVVLCVGEEDAFYREERAHIRDKGLENLFYFLPFVPDVASTLKGLDVVAMPSHREAYSLLAMEIMVAGVPLIGTNCIGLREVLNGTPATVVAARDSRALSIALLKEMKDSTKGTARVFASEAASRFDVKRPAANLEKLMLKLVSP